jgi:hypothetical protein
MNSFVNLIKKFSQINISKIIIIFSIGLIPRIVINCFFDINVFRDFLHPFSITYYIIFASFVVFVNELFSTYNFNIFYYAIELFKRIYSPSFKIFKLYFKRFIHLYYNNQTLNINEGNEYNLLLPKNLTFDTNNKNSVTSASNSVSSSSSVTNNSVTNSNNSNND